MQVDLSINSKVFMEVKVEIVKEYAIIEIMKFTRESGGVKMAGYLIAETTREEREKIVAESLGNIEANCDGCMAGLAEMYQEYIDGKKELRQINMEFNARYVKSEDMPVRSRCPESFC